MYEFDARIRYSEVDSEERLTLVGLLNYFQDISTFHSEDCGVGMEYLGRHGLVWVLNSWQIDVLQYAKLFQNVRVGTIPYEIKGFLGYRNFYMKDAKSGCRLAAANSIWTLMDIKRAKPCRVPEEITEAYGVSERLDMEYKERRVRFGTAGVQQEPIIVKNHHLDTNRHVNNGQYVRIAMDFLPPGFVIDRLRAEYKRSALLGEVMVPVIYREEGTVGVSLQASDKTVYANIEFSRLEE